MSAWIVPTECHCTAHSVPNSTDTRLMRRVRKDLLQQAAGSDFEPVKVCATWKAHLILIRLRELKGGR